MEQQDIRWQQRFSNYRKALRKLAAAVEIVTEESHMGHDIDELLQEGLYNVSNIHTKWRGR